MLITNIWLKLVSKRGRRVSIQKRLNGEGRREVLSKVFSQTWNNKQQTGRERVEKRERERETVRAITEGERE